MALNKLPLFIVLSLIVVTSFIGNQLVFNMGLSTMRMPASATITTGTSFSDGNDMDLTLVKIAKVKDRVITSIGREPNQLDNLRFGILEGKYALTLSGEKIKDIEFVNTPNSEGSPKRIADRILFIKSNAALLNIKYDIKKLNTEIVGRKIVETFKAINADTDSEVSIKIELDELDRLYRLTAIDTSKVF